LWHGLGLIACRAWHKLGWPMPKVTGWAVTMMFVAVGWVLFRAASFTVAGSMALSLAGAGSWAGSLPEIKLLIAAALASALIPSAHQIIDRRIRCWPPAARCSRSTVCFRSAAAHRSISSISSSRSTDRAVNPRPCAACVLRPIDRLQTRQ
jgi:hypothetical protein